ncbi:MAG: SMI1/KNR4 family protein [Acutalibacteraceae bacterium]|nr:SMI1/KNR4 family protein [Acutalibacteraceae bacterium]
MSKNIVEVIKMLPDLLLLKPATNTQITDAELQLRVSFAEEYKAYLKEFGAIMADGIELTGIAKSKHRNVVSITEQERALNPNVPHTMYVIENTSVDGIIIWQDTIGSIYQTQPNLKPKKIADSLAEYVENHK